MKTYLPHLRKRETPEPSEKKREEIEERPIPTPKGKRQHLGGVPAAVNLQRIISEEKGLNLSRGKKGKLLLKRKAGFQGRTKNANARILGVELLPLRKVGEWLGFKKSDLKCGHIGKKGE